MDVQVYVVEIPNILLFVLGSDEDTTMALLAGIPTLLLVVLGIMSYMKKRSTDIRLEGLAEHGRNAKVLEYTYVDVVLFGPRASGKTAIAKLWTSPWTQISEDYVATTTWCTYEASIHEGAPVRRRDDIFRVDRTYIPTVRVRVHDYPGENQYRQQAVRDLAKLGSKTVVICILNVGFLNGKILYDQENGEYYSRQFVEDLESNLKRLSDNVAKAIVVFNKSDLLPQEWDNDRAFEELVYANRDVVSLMRRQFDPNIEYCVSSALTNKGIIRMLGIVGRVGLANAPREAEIFMGTMRASATEFGDDTLEARYELAAAA